MLLHSCVTCGCANNVYFSEKAEELQGGSLRRTLSSLLQNLPEHAQDWLEIAFSGFFFVVPMYLTVRLAGESGESSVQTPLARQAGSFGFQERKRKRLPPTKTVCSIP